MASEGKEAAEQENAGASEGSDRPEEAEFRNNVLIARDDYCSLCQHQASSSLFSSTNL